MHGVGNTLRSPTQVRPHSPREVLIAEPLPSSVRRWIDDRARPRAPTSPGRSTCDTCVVELRKLRITRQGAAKSWRKQATWGVAHHLLRAREHEDAPQAPSETCGLTLP